MKKAVLVGINKYTQGPLRGCVNDVIVMFKILTTQFGFKPEDIKVITDYEATKKNIIEGIKWLTEGVGEGDQIVLHYSGHGSQVMVDDRSSFDDIDGRDEILCPHDMNWADPLRDHDVGLYFKRVPKSCETLVILDCCHSGSGLRNGFGPGKLYTEDDWVNRFIAPPLSNLLLNPALIIDDDLTFEFDMSDSRSLKKGFIVDTVDQGDAILIAGCQDNQTSADAWINRKYQGAMTYALASTLSKYNYDVTYEQLITDVNILMDSFNFTQNPQLEGKCGFFGKKFLR